MALPPVPTLTNPPDAPTRGDDQTTFSTKANAFVAWQANDFKPEIDSALSWMDNAYDETVAVYNNTVAVRTDTSNIRDDAYLAKTGAETAQGLSEAAQLASETAQGLSEDARDSAQVAAAAAQAAVGLPSLVGKAGRALSVKGDETGVEWSPSIPTGGIIMWSGSEATIPSGWFLCNGLNGTPNLVDRFVVGAGSAYNVGNSGGSKDAIVVAHTHTFNETSSENGGHSHGAGTYGAASNGGHTHTLSINNYVGVDVESPSNSSPWLLTVKDANANKLSVAMPQGSAVLAGEHGHTIIGNSASVGNHSHIVSGTTSSVGSSGTNRNLPPYYALCFIMKG